MKKWKFIHNGLGWWLRIESSAQLMEYIEATDSSRFGEGMIKVRNRYNRGDDFDTHNRDEMADAIGVLWKYTGLPLNAITGEIMLACHSTYFKLLREEGFVDINPVGGCNAFTKDVKATVYRDNLVFPCYTEKDIRIKTWEWEDKKNGVNRPYGYKYHYYAYLGDMQLKDGEPEKWNTREEVLEFAKTFLETEKPNDY